MTDVAVLILHPAAAGRAAELESWVAASRLAIAEHHRTRFIAAGATDATIVSGPPDRLSFGARLRAYVDDRQPDGLVVLGSGAIPLARSADLRQLVAVAGSRERIALANNRYSADVVAVANARDLLEVGDLATDNALPRWLAEACGYDVSDLGRRWRLGVDVDEPLDLLLIGERRWLPPPPAAALDRARDRLATIRTVAADRGAELLVAGRLTGAGLAWLERSTRSRTRALVEERGLRTRAAGQRPAASVLGVVLDRDGPAALGEVVARLGDAAIVDSRVLIAHHFGADERRWPPPEDRFASDLLLVERVRDPWLAALTASVADAAVPILMGGHGLVGPGLRLALGGAGSWS